MFCVKIFSPFSAFSTGYMIMCATFVLAIVMSDNMRSHRIHGQESEEKYKFSKVGHHEAPKY